MKTGSRFLKFGVRLALAAMFLSPLSSMAYAGDSGEANVVRNPKSPSATDLMVIEECSANELTTMQVGQVPDILKDLAEKVVDDWCRSDVEDTVRAVCKQNGITDERVIQAITSKVMQQVNRLPTGAKLAATKIVKEFVKDYIDDGKVGNSSKSSSGSSTRRSSGSSTGSSSRSSTKSKKDEEILIGVLVVGGIVLLAAAASGGAA